MLNLLESAIDDMYVVDRLDDQTLFWNFILNGRGVLAPAPPMSGKLRVSALDGARFATGQAKIIPNATMYHANFAVGGQTKQDMLARHGLWVLKQGATESRADTCNNQHAPTCKRD